MVDYSHVMSDTITMWLNAVGHLFLRATNFADFVDF